jgi:carbon monoxide dehydrogenase subunit G
MSISKYVSDVKTINNNNEVVYNFLSDFNNLSVFFNEFTLAQISQQIPKANIENFESDTESCRFTISSVGEAGLRIIEREFPKTIKIAGEGKIPFELFLWIQILPVTPYQSKIRLTLHANMNMMMKMVAGKKMKEGINKLADALTMLPYR